MITLMLTLVMTFVSYFVSYRSSNKITLVMSGAQEVSPLSSRTLAGLFRTHPSAKQRRSSFSNWLLRTWQRDPHH